MILRLDNSGNIPNCANISESSFLVFDTSFAVNDSDCTIKITDATITETNVLSQNSSAEITTICDGNDIL